MFAGEAEGASSPHGSPVINLTCARLSFSSVTTICSTSHFCPAFNSPVADIPVPGTLRHSTTHTLVVRYAVPSPRKERSPALVLPSLIYGTRAVARILAFFIALTRPPLQDADPVHVSHEARGLRPPHPGLVDPHTVSSSSQSDLCLRMMYIFPHAARDLCLENDRHVLPHVKSSKE